MRVLIVENYKSTPAGLVGAALREAGAEVDLRRAHLGEPLPDAPDGHDGIVILGGEQNALADAACPWFPGLARPDPRLRRRRQGGARHLPRRAARRPRLRGAEHPRAPGRVRLARGAADRGRPRRPGARRRSATGSPVFHWHEDTFTLPPGAAHLAASAMTEHQAFRIGRAVYGVQFHFEADRPLVEDWSAEFAPTILGYAPDWPERHPVDAARLGAAGRRDRARSRPALGPPRQAGRQRAKSSRQWTSLGEQSHEVCHHPSRRRARGRRRAGRGRGTARPRRAHRQGGHRERLHAAQLRRPQDRRGDRLGIRRLQRDRQAPQPQGRVEPVELGHHDPGGPRGPVRRRHGRHHHHRRAQGAGRLLRPLHDLAAVHAGARRRGPLHRRRVLRRRTPSC